MAAEAAGATRSRKTPTRIENNSQENGEEFLLL